MPTSDLFQKKDRKPRRRKTAYIALMSVLIISALLLVFLSSAQLVGTSNLQGTLAGRVGTEVDFLAESCWENTLLKLRTTPDYAGETNLSVLDGFCDIAVVNLGDNRYQVDVQAAALDSYYKILTATVTIVLTAETKKIEVENKIYH